MGSGGVEIHARVLEKTCFLIAPFMRQNMLDVMRDRSSNLQMKHVSLASVRPFCEENVFLLFSGWGGGLACPLRGWFFLKNYMFFC